MLTSQIRINEIDNDYRKDNVLYKEFTFWRSIQCQLYAKWSGWMNSMKMIFDWGSFKWNIVIHNVFIISIRLDYKIAYCPCVDNLSFVATAHFGDFIVCFFQTYFLTISTFFADFFLLLLLLHFTLWFLFMLCCYTVDDDSD